MPTIPIREVSTKCEADKEAYVAAPPKILSSVLKGVLVVSNATLPNTLSTIIFYTLNSIEIWTVIYIL